METVNPTLLEQLKTLPTSPGVYLFNDRRNKLLYVGKASNLRQRVRSYFQNSPKGPRIDKMVSEIHSLKVVVCQTEAEALLLENSFIKNNKPFYNVLLRDDKTYPYIVVTDEPFPRVLFTRRKGKKGQYYGPFPSARAARQTIKLLHKHFHIRNCDLELGQKTYRPCLQFHIKRCQAPCAHLVEQEDYAEGVARAELFLAGKTEDLTKELKQKMLEASQGLAFERAAYYRDLLGLVSSCRQRTGVAGLAYEKLDVVGTVTDGWQAVIMVMAIRSGALVRSTPFHVEWARSPEEDFSNWLSHYYINHEDPPDELVVAERRDLNLLEQIFPDRKKRSIQVTVPQRGAKRRLLEMAQDNARVAMNMADDEQAEDHPGLTQLADVLGLPDAPRHIECFDISNIMGTYSVASMVCFLNGRPSKTNYRKFNIKSVEGPDDFASMAEVVGRRYKRLLEEGSPLPQLIMVDGGLGQLHAAWEALVALGLGEHPLISLAKREEWVYTTRDQEPIVIDHHEPALRLLQHIRDESHRFAITTHRKKRGKGMLKSELDGIPGVGPKRAQKLLHHFGSVKRIKQANLDQLSAVVGKNVARAVFEALRH